MIKILVADDEPDVVEVISVGLSLNSPDWEVSSADDYITKPFSPLELTARIRALLRRTQRGKSIRPQNFSFQDLFIDYASRNVTVNGEGVRLTAIEYNLLCLLASHAGQVVSHSFL